MAFCATHGDPTCSCFEDEGEPGPEPDVYECRYCAEERPCVSCRDCGEPYCAECMAEHGGDECIRARKGLQLHIDERGWE